MKKQFTNKSNFLKSIFFKLAIVTVLLLITQISSSVAQIYARVEIENLTPYQSPGVIQKYGDVYVRYYSDYQCTMPVQTPSTGFTLNILSWSNNTNNWYNSYPYTVSSGASVYETLLESNTPIDETDYYEDECITPRFYSWGSWDVQDDGNSGLTYLAAPTVGNP